MIDLNKDDLLKEARAMYTYFPGAYGNRMLSIVEMLCKPTWMHIETAPKDGTFILAWFEEAQQHLLLWWFADHWRFKGSDTIPLMDPTHWMPLPKPPKEG